MLQGGGRGLCKHMSGGRRAVSARCAAAHGLVACMELLQAALQPSVQSALLHKAYQAWQLATAARHALVLRATHCLGGGANQGKGAWATQRSHPPAAAARQAYAWALPGAGCSLHPAALGYQLDGILSPSWWRQGTCPTCTACTGCSSCSGCSWGRWWCRASGWASVPCTAAAAANGGERWDACTAGSPASRAAYSG